jgi:regulator of protease activity HflC (stomatin/prohibitin superfamily)
MKMYVLIVALVSFLLVMFGGVLPYLVSAKSDLAVISAWFLGILSLPLVFYIVKKANIMQKLKALFTRIAPAILLMLTLAACDNVNAGYVGVKVDKLGSNKGVQTEVVGPGKYWIGINEELFIFPTFTVTDTWGRNTGPKDNPDQSIGFQTIEGLSVKAEVGITFHFDEKKVATIFQKYRRGVEEISDTFLRNLTRDAFVTAASTQSIEYIYGAGKTELMKEVERLVRAEVGDIGIIVENITTVSEFRLPQIVYDAINAKITATQTAQQRQNEVAEAKAAADKKVEEARGDAESIRLRAIAQAEANIILARSINPTLVQYKAIEKWNGELPRLTGQGAIPFINVEGATK